MGYQHEIAAAEDRLTKRINKLSQLVKEYQREIWSLQRLLVVKGSITYEELEKANQGDFDRESVLK